MMTLLFMFFMQDQLRGLRAPAMGSQSVPSAEEEDHSGDTTGCNRWSSQQDDKRLTTQMEMEGHADPPLTCTCKSVCI